MAKHSSGRRKYRLIYERHAFRPHDLLTFVELRSFTKAWDDMGLTDDDLNTLQIGIMAMPKAAPVVAGTGGLRKIRFAPVGWSKGKSGALRACYVHFEDHGIVLLVLVYRKNERDDLSASEKRSIRRLIQEAEKELAKAR